MARDFTNNLCVARHIGIHSASVLKNARSNINEFLEMRSEIIKIRESYKQQNKEMIGRSSRIMDDTRTKQTKFWNKLRSRSWVIAITAGKVNGLSFYTLLEWNRPMYRNHDEATNTHAGYLYHKHMKYADLHQSVWNEREKAERRRREHCLLESALAHRMKPTNCNCLQQCALIRRLECALITQWPH